MKIALIIPPGDFIRAGLGAKTSLQDGNLPPLGLAYLASALEREGHQPILIDAPSQKLTPTALEKLLFDLRPEALGISLKILDFSSGITLANRLREGLNIPLILGGPFLTSSYPDLLPQIHPPAYLILGEGEIPLPALLKSITQNDSTPQIPGVLFWSPERKLLGLPNPHPALDIDSYPSPAYHLYADRKYRPLPSYSRNLPATTMITSRGCPYRKCAFCFQGGAFSSPYRRHSPGRIISEIQYLLAQYRIKEIYFLDDIFTFNNDWLEEFCRTIIEKQIDFRWVCYGKADLVNREMLASMKKAGCYQIKFGFESGDQNLLDSIQKGFTLEQVRKTIRWCREAGIEINASFILGLPGENPERGQKTIDFALELDLDFAEFFAFQPFPGTPLYEISTRKGRRRQDHPPGNIHEPIFIPDGYPGAGSIRRLITQGYQRFYLRPSYLAKTLRKTRSLGDLKRYWNGLRLLAGIIRKIESGSENPSA